MAKTRTPLPLKSVAFGVNFQPTWQVRDRLGYVADRVLRSPAFGPEVFPSSDTLTTRHVLHDNPDNPDNRLELAERHCILSMDVSGHSLEDVLALGGNFEHTVVSHMVEAGMDRIWRFGCLFRLAECSSHFDQPPKSLYLPDEPNARDFDLRFTRRLPAESARLSASTMDYVNLIYMVSQADDGSVSLSIDYQQYFEPEVSGRKLKPFSEFTRKAIRYYEDEYHLWLERFSSGMAA